MSVLALALLAACAAPQDGTAPATAPVPPDCSAAGMRRGEEWRRVASDPDRARLRDWRTTWTAALERGPVGQGGDADLFAADRALADATPPHGAYRCRIHHLGKGPAVTPDWVGCRIEEDKGRARFVVEDGAQRPVGFIYPDTASRAVFLGTVMIGDEARPLRYGRDRLRDLAGFVERIGERRWRVALPRPSFGGELDLIELVPA